MNFSKNEIIGLTLALVGLFSSSADAAGLTGPGVILGSQDIVHNEVLAANGSPYGQCVARDFEVRNDRENPPKIDLLNKNVMLIGSLVESKGTDFTNEKLTFVVKKMLATQCGGSQPTGDGK